MVLEIIERMNEFAQLPGNEIFAEALAYRYMPGRTHTGISRLPVADLVVAMYLDMLCNYCQWNISGPNDQYTEEQWRKMVPRWKDVTREQEIAMFNAVVQPAYEVIGDWAEQFKTTADGWHVWGARRVGLDVIIEKGEDYRILDWNRRMELAKEYVDAESKDEPLPPEAWVPDHEARRFVELLRQQMREPSPLGKMAIENHDKELARRKAQAKPNRKQRGRQYSNNSGTL
ncbi:hypothetical protein [Xanthomonas phage RTH11]|nr:hypothetical protein [Xanthomonas phage RTH11]